MQLATHPRQSLVRFALRLTEFLDLRPTDPIFGQGSWEGVWVDLVSVSQREPDEVVGLGAGAPPGRWQTKSATRGVPARTSNGRSATTRRYDQPDYLHRDKPFFSVPILHMHSPQTPTQLSIPSEEHGQTGSVRRYTQGLSEMEG